MAGNAPFDREKQKFVIMTALEAKPQTRLWLRCFLFLLDLEAYRDLGHSITGARYRRGKKAPIVEGLSRSMRELEQEGYMERARMRPTLVHDG